MATTITAPTHNGYYGGYPNGTYYPNNRVYTNNGYYGNYGTMAGNPGFSVGFNNGLSDGRNARFRGNAGYGSAYEPL